MSESRNWFVRWFVCRECGRYQGIRPRRKACLRCTARRRAAIAELREAIVGAEVQLANACKHYLINLLNSGRDTDEAIESTLSHYISHGLTSFDADAIRSRFERIRIFSHLQRGSFPVLTNPGFPLYIGETAHFIFDNVPLMERQIVEQMVVTTGSSFTLFDQGIAFTFGGSESQVVTRSADVTLGIGRLVLTSHRLIYSSHSAAFDVPWVRSSNVSYSDNEISFFVMTSGTHGTRARLGCDDAQYLCACCNALRANSR